MPDARTQEIIRKIRKIEIHTKKIVNSVFSGEYHSSYKGRGMEFDEVRMYYPGDDVRTIDWNVTARTGDPHVKQFKEERELVVFILFDASASNEFGTAKVLKGEAAAEISALLTFSAIQNNDKVGLVIFTDEVERYLPPDKGRGHMLRIIREILYFQTKKSGTNIENALDFLNKMTRKRSVVFLISDMMDEGFETVLGITSRRHDLAAIKITDPRELHLPSAGLVEFEDAETGEAFILDTSSPAFKKNYRLHAEEREKRTQKLFQRVKADFINVNTEEDFLEEIVRFFKAKVKKIRR